MAFTDALVDHADVEVVMVDRRHGAGGHWLDAYPFVRLHQASAFYGVPSTLLGGGRIQQEGPETGLHERATAPEICAYYARVLQERLVGSGRVSFHPGCDYVGDGRFVSQLTGEQTEVRVRRRVVDARYLSPQIPARTPPPFGIADGVHVVAVNDLVDVAGAPSQYVIVGAGKTATDACIWLLDNGVDPDAICWVRPREPWMLNRAVVQPDPAVFIGMAADVLEAAASALSPDDMFLRMEEAGVMLRVDRSVTPTMAKAPTLAQWELDRLRTIEHVVRLGHVRGAEPGRLLLTEGEVTTARDAVVVHCAAAGLQYRPLVPIWGPEEITVQPIRSGFPVLRGGAGWFRGGHRRERRGEEPAVPAVPVPGHTHRLGPDAGARRPGGDGVLLAHRHQGLGGQCLAQPGPHTTGDGRIGRAEGRHGTVPQARRTRHVPAGRARRDAAGPVTPAAGQTRSRRPRLASWPAMMTRCTSLAPSQIRSTRSSR